MTDIPKGEEEPKVTDIKALIERLTLLCVWLLANRQDASAESVREAADALEELKGCEDQAHTFGLEAARLRAELAEEKRKAAQLTASLADEKTRLEEAEKENKSIGTAYQNEHGEVVGLQKELYQAKHDLEGMRSEWLKKDRAFEAAREYAALLESNRDRKLQFTPDANDYAKVDAEIAERVSKANIEARIKGKV